MTETKPLIRPETAARIKKFQNVTEKHDPHLLAYTTKGGTYMIASNGKQLDDERPRDIAALTVNGLIVLSPFANPLFLIELRAIFD